MPQKSLLYLNQFLDTKPRLEHSATTSELLMELEIEDQDFLEWEL